MILILNIIFLKELFLMHLIEKYNAESNPKLL